MHNGKRDREDQADARGRGEYNLRKFHPRQGTSITIPVLVRKLTELPYPIFARKSLPLQAIF